MEMSIQCEDLPLVEIIYEANHERVDQLVKTLHTYVKSIGTIYMYVGIDLYASLYTKSILTWYLIDVRLRFLHCVILLSYQTSFLLGFREVYCCLS